MNNKGNVTLYVIGAILAVCTIVLCLDAMDKIDKMSLNSDAEPKVTIKNKNVR